MLGALAEVGWTLGLLVLAAVVFAASRRAAVALHEASHAATAILLGFSPRVSLDPPSTHVPGATGGAEKIIRHAGWIFSAAVAGAATWAWAKSVSSGLLSLAPLGAPTETRKGATHEYRWWYWLWLTELVFIDKKWELREKKLKRGDLKAAKLDDDDDVPDSESSDSDPVAGDLGTRINKMLVGLGEAPKPIYGAKVGKYLDLDFMRLQWLAHVDDDARTVVRGGA